MQIIGITGLIGSGKDEAVEYIYKKYGYKIVSMGDISRELVRKENLEVTRINIQKIQHETRKKYGTEVIAKYVVNKIKENKWDKVVINGLRRSEEVRFFLKEFKKEIIIIRVKADKLKRFKRLNKRGTSRDPKTIKEFEKQEKDEYAFFDFDNVFKYVNYEIENNGTLKELHKKIDNIMKKIEK